MLCDMGVARRVHGGVQRINTSGNVACAWRHVHNHDVKQTIAQEVAHHVPNGVSIALSIGTTPEMVSKALLAHTH
jgi:DeoR family glycerol-3-phosphate regulon repressor